MAPLLMRRVGGLLCFDLLQHRRQPLVVDDVVSDGAWSTWRTLSKVR
jgi:hypothetical protein